MENLPLEILHKIASCLIEGTRRRSAAREGIPKNSLAAYATISRQWQSIVEAIIFRHLYLTSTRLAAPEAENCLVPGRLAHVRHIWVDFKFPAHDLAVSTNPQDYDDQLVFDRITRQVFDVLARIPPRQEPSVVLEFYVSTPREWYILAYPRWTYWRPSDVTAVALGRVRTTYLELSSHWGRDAPELATISVFRTDLKSMSLVFAPSSINIIASKMVRLKKVVWHLSDAEKIDADLRIRQRTRFARTLDKLPKSLESFNLIYNRDPPINRYFQPSSIVPPDAPGDILSLALFHFIQRDGLLDFNLYASVDSTLLWPQSQDPDDNPNCPTLQWFHVELNEVLPSGQWISMRDHGDDSSSSSDSDDYDRKCDIPGEEYERRYSESTYDQTVMNRFALAAGRRANHMPKIKDFYVNHDGSSPMGIGFVTRKPNKPCLEFSGDEKVPELSEEALDAWRETVRERDLEWNLHITGNMSDAKYFF